MDDHHQHSNDHAFLDGGHDAHVMSPMLTSGGQGFTPQDIQDLLGSVLEDDHQHHDQQQQQEEEQGCPKVARIERKRSREKQRRSDINKQFSLLQQTLRQIEAEDDACRSGHLPANISNSSANRVELIGRTVHILQQLHASNKRHKTNVKDLQVQLEAAKQAGEETAQKLKQAMEVPQPTSNPNQVMMMVPMVMSTDASGATPAAPAMHPMMPFGMHAAVLPSQQPQAVATSTGTPAAPMMPPHAMSMPWMVMPTAAAAAATPTATTAAPTTTATPAAPAVASESTATANTKPAPPSEGTAGNLAHCA